MGKESFSPEKNNKETTRPIIETEISVDLINVLSQPRKTFNDVEYLAQSIDENGLMNRILVGKFSKNECENLVKSINDVWKSDHKIENLKSDKEKNEDKYYVLIAGERRFRAIKLLEMKKVDVKLYSNICVNKFHSIQASENIHESVPSHEEAYYYSALYKESKRENPNLSMARFCREMGRSGEKIRSALRFCELPVFVIDLVEKGTLSYGVASQIGRLKQQVSDVTEDQIQYWAIKAVAKNYNVGEFTKVISRYIEEKTAEKSQLNYFGLIEQRSESELRKTEIKKIINESTSRGLWGFIHYFKTINSFFDNGQIDKGDHPFSSNGIASLFFGVVNLEKELLPKLKHSLSKEKYLVAQEVVNKTCQILEENKVKPLESFRVSFD